MVLIPSRVAAWAYYVDKDPSGLKVTMGRK